MSSVEQNVANQKSMRMAYAVVGEDLERKHEGMDKNAFKHRRRY